MFTKFSYLQNPLKKIVQYLFFKCVTISNFRLVIFPKTSSKKNSEKNCHVFCTRDERPLSVNPQTKHDQMQTPALKHSQKYEGAPNFCISLFLPLFSSRPLFLPPSFSLFSTLFLSLPSIYIARAAVPWVCERERGVSSIGVIVWFHNPFPNKHRCPEQKKKKRKVVENVVRGGGGRKSSFLLFLHLSDQFMRIWVWNSLSMWLIGLWSV